MASEIEPTQSTSVKRTIARGIFQFLLMAFVLFAGFWGMNYLTSLKEERPSRPPFKTVYTVTSMTAKKGNFQPNMLVYGEVQTSRQIELRSLVAGKIVDIHPNLKAGVLIQKDEGLFQIDPFDFDMALVDANANRNETLARISENEARINIEKMGIVRMRDQLFLARNDLERIESLKKRGTATDKQVEDRKLIVSQREQLVEQSELNIIAEQARMEQLRSILARYDASITTAKKDLEDTIFTAPITGIISTENVAIGRVVSANDVVVTMYDATQLEVRFTLTDQRFGRIQSDPAGVVGRTVEVIWSVGGEEFRYPATIDRISAEISSDRGGVEVIAVLKEAIAISALRPGAFVELIVPDKLFSEHFRIPDTSIYDNETVYQIVEGRLKAAKVQISARDGDHVIVTGAIEDDAEILITRIAEISNGISVVTQKQLEEQKAGGAQE
ncbi:MAG: HlyD family efflux transporter periplasmic adaptor subunit [Pseudomonadota bacterium]